MNSVKTQKKQNPDIKYKRMMPPRVSIHTFTVIKHCRDRPNFDFVFGFGFGGKCGEMSTFGIHSGSAASSRLTCGILSVSAWCVLYF